MELFLATSNHQQGDGAWVKMRINKGQELVIGGYVPTGNNFDSLIVGPNKDRRNARISGWSYLGFPFWILIQTRTNAKLGMSAAVLVLSSGLIVILTARFPISNFPARS